VGQANNVLQAGEDRPQGGRRKINVGTAGMEVHLTDSTLADGAGVARGEEGGPGLLSQLRDWLGHRSGIVKAVIHIPGIRPVDCYEVPESIKEAVRLRNPASCFPFSTNTNRSGDNDHTIEYVDPDEGGPPGQTSLANLGRMPRFEHRLKTHGGW